MGIDLAALKAKLAAQQKPASTSGGNNGILSSTQRSGINAANNASSSNANVPVASAVGAVQATSESNISSTVPTVNTPATLGTSKTTEIEHLDFLSKMNSLADAIHKQHPTMPVLLMQIHKQLRSDPELVTTLDEDAIGIIVKGLQVQTKTELVTAATKETKKKKNPAISVDMF